MALWIVATPIGTLGDLSPRARERLVAVDVVAAEDTRVVRRLLHAVGLHRGEVVALHAHNEDGLAASLAERARTGEVALVSDAGTPGISDPGRALVAACHAAGVPVLSVPGPSALAAALAASGFPAAPSTFLGFPPRKGRENWAAEVLGRPETLVMYEAPTRIAGLVAALAAVDPHRPAAMCRELSKAHEEVRVLPMAALAADLSARSEIRGEVVLVVGPGTSAQAAPAATLDEGAGLKDIAAVLAARWEVSRREAYERLLAIEKGLAGDEGA
jgi:16S rRNA (cytidine1402-2'-O)-methyltransferase